MVLKKKEKIVNVILFGILVASSLALGATLIEASDPEQVEVGYTIDEEGTDFIWVDVYHHTDNVDTHYISKIEVKLNGLEVMEETYESQPTGEYFGIIEDGFDLIDGDVIETLVFCNSGGELYDSVTVGEQDSLPLPFWPIIIGLTIISFVVLKIRKNN